LKNRINRFSIFQLLSIFRPSRSGLPDSTFAKQKSQFGYILGDLGMEMVGLGILSIAIFYGHQLTYCRHFVYFSPFWYAVPRKIWQPCSRYLLKVHGVGGFVWWWFPRYKLQQHANLIKQVLLRPRS
jgi:hypothetical protein